MKESLEMEIEFEPEYLERFKAYVRTKTIIAEALYVLSLMRHKKVSKEIKERVLKGLNLLKDELVYFQENKRHKSYVISLLCRDDINSIDNILSNIQNLIDTISGKDRITDEEYNPLRNFFLDILSRLIKESKPLEEKVLGRFRTPRTYYP